MNPEAWMRLRCIFWEWKKIIKNGGETIKLEAWSQDSKPSAWERCGGCAVLNCCNEQSNSFPHSKPFLLEPIEEVPKKRQLSKSNEMFTKSQFYSTIFFRHLIDDPIKVFSCEKGFCCCCCFFLFLFCMENKPKYPSGISRLLKPGIFSLFFPPPNVGVQSGR